MVSVILSLPRSLGSVRETGGLSQIFRIGELFEHEALLVGGPESFVERARIAEARGQKELAAQHYRSFLRRFVLPDARLKHLRDEVEAALARLEGRAVREGPSSH